MEDRLMFRRSLNRIASELGRQDLENLKFMCKDVIPVARLEKVRSALDLFVALEERGHLGKDNLEFLANCMATIGRYPLLAHLKGAGYNVPDPAVNGASTHPVPVKGDLHAATEDEFLFTQLLMQISQQLQAHQVDQLAYCWCEPLLGITKENVYSATQLFTLMQQREYITPTNLDCLYDQLGEIGRQDLMKLVDDYLRKTGQEKSKYSYHTYHQQPELGNLFHSSPPSYASTPPYGIPPRPSELQLQQPSSPFSSMSDTSMYSRPTLDSEGKPGCCAQMQEQHLIHYPPSIRRAQVPLSAPNQPGHHLVTDNTGDQRSEVSKEESPTPYGVSPTARINPQLTFPPDESQQSTPDHMVLLQQKNAELAKKEDEINQLMGQLNYATSTRDQQSLENTEMIRMHKIEIVRLQDDLKQKNSELDKLRREMNELYSAMTSGGNGEDFYKMPNTPHGICLIINNHKFHSVDPRFEALTERGGASVDQQNLVSTFQFLQYHVEVRENCTSEQMIDLMKAMSDRDHSRYDSFICCILSHGEEGRIFGADSRPVDLKDMTGLIKGTLCRTLVDKPKLFFVQACRGEGEDPGIKVLRDAVGNSSLPVEADFLFGYATPPGNAAYRSRRHGSWFISELCQVFCQDSHILGLGHMMKKVNRKVSDAYTKEGHKQCTEVVDRLRKEVHFFRDYTQRR